MSHFVNRAAFFPNSKNSLKTINYIRVKQNVTKWFIQSMLLHLKRRKRRKDRRILFWFGKKQKYNFFVFEMVHLQTDRFMNQTKKWNKNHGDTKETYQHFVILICQKVFFAYQLLYLFIIAVKLVILNVQMATSYFYDCVNCL